MTLINIDTIPTSSPLHPLSLFADIARELDIAQCEEDTSHDSLVYTFSLFKSQATPEFIDALNLIAAVNEQTSANVT